jgi:hypothetical protein
LTTFVRTGSRVICALALLLLAATITHAQTTPEDLPLLRRYVPGLDDEMQKLPPFLRDTEFNLHVRSFYFNRLNSAKDSNNEAWAGGGWIEYKSGWLADTFAIGAVGYTSQPLYAPDDKDGTGLLHTGQEAIVTLGQAYGQLRYKDYVVLTGYRQLIDEGYVNPQDNRMIPNLHEAATFKGLLGPIGYNVGYILQQKQRAEHGFHNMAEEAGVSGDHNRGLILTRLSSVDTLVKGLSLYAANYYVPDVFNTAYGNLEYTHPLGKELAVKVGFQLTDQRSVGSEFLGDFTTVSFGAHGLVSWRGLTTGPTFYITDTGAAVRTPYGTWPGYLSYQERDFDRAGEKAFGFEATYNFDKGTLLPFNVPGLSVLLRYAEGRDAVNPSTNADLPRVREGNFDVIWNIPGVKGLQLRFRNAYVAESGDRVVQGFRIILNYELPLL